MSWLLMPADGKALLLGNVTARAKAIREQAHAVTMMYVALFINAITTFVPHRAKSTVAKKSVRNAEVFSTVSRNGYAHRKTELHCF